MSQDSTLEGSFFIEFAICLRNKIARTFAAGRDYLSGEADPIFVECNAPVAYDPSLNSKLSRLYEDYSGEKDIDETEESETDVCVKRGISYRDTHRIVNSMTDCNKTREAEYLERIESLNKHFEKKFKLPKERRKELSIYSLACRKFDIILFDPGFIIQSRIECEHRPLQFKYENSMSQIAKARLRRGTIKKFLAENFDYEKIFPTDFHSEIYRADHREHNIRLKEKEFREKLNIDDLDPTRECHVVFQLCCRSRIVSKKTRDLWNKALFGTMTFCLSLNHADFVDADKNKRNKIFLEEMNTGGYMKKCRLFVEKCSKNIIDHHNWGERANIYLSTFVQKVPFPAAFLNRYETFSRLTALKDPIWETGYLKTWEQGDVMRCAFREINTEEGVKRYAMQESSNGDEIKENLPRFLLRGMLGMPEYLEVSKHKLVQL